jgi:hypothetical protein
MEFPQYLTATEVSITYQGTEGGVFEATTAIKIIRRVFPNSRIVLKNAGKSGTLIIYCKNKKILDKRSGDIGLNKDNVRNFVEILRNKVREV